MILAAPARSRARLRRLAPAQVIATGFGVTILLGALILMLPVSSAEGIWTSFLDALFTATSAVCVTGLIVVDTAVHWSPFGKVVILALIQVGGLGIMLFAALIGLALARRLSVRSRLITGAETKAQGVGDLRGLAVGILLTTLAIEAVVAALLFVRFLTGYGYDVGRAAWHAVFHSVSSFNNAGFALFSDNLIGFAGDPLILMPIAPVVVAGSLGVPVMMELRRELRPRKWRLHTS